MPRTIFHPVCGAKLRGKPGRFCQCPRLRGRSKCGLHGGLTPRGLKRRPDAAKPGPKPRGPAIAEARKARARLWRTNPDLAIALLPFTARPLPSAPRQPRSSPPQAAPAPNPPPWPPDGYRGSDDARRLEASEREFIRELAAPISLETMLAQTGKSLFGLSAWETDQVLTGFVQGRQQHLSEWLAYFAKAEAAYRRQDDGEAIKQRLARLQWEADDYLERLGTEKAVLIVQAEDRERQAHARAIELSQRIVAGRDVRAENRAMTRREEQPRLTIDPRYK